MEKRYQVFLSSTYSDLLEERAEVMQALLELNCMPAGMELFPAASEEQWSWIKKVIEESDYYIVIVGGRYGSVSGKTGLSYTEMEYRYAVEIGKPVIAFLHENPAKIEAGKTEENKDGKKKLEQFRKYVEQKLCKYWLSPSDLGAKVSRSFVQLINRFPAEGWVRASQVDEEATREILALRRNVETLEKKLSRLGLEAPKGSELLASGPDYFTIEFQCVTEKQKTGGTGSKYWVKGETVETSVEYSWDDLFTIVAPILIRNASEREIHAALARELLREARVIIAKQLSENRVLRAEIYSHCFNTMIIQMRALGLITAADDKYYWTLTAYGDQYMNNLLAIKKNPDL